MAIGPFAWKSDGRKDTPMELCVTAAISVSDVLLVTACPSFSLKMRIFASIVMCSARVFAV